MFRWIVLLYGSCWFRRPKRTGLSITVVLYQRSSPLSISVQTTAWSRWTAAGNLWSSSRTSGSERRWGRTKEKWWWVNFLFLSEPVWAKLKLNLCRPALLCTTGEPWSWVGRRTPWEPATCPCRTSVPTQSIPPAGPVSYLSAPPPLPLSYFRCQQNSGMLLLRWFLLRIFVISHQKFIVNIWNDTSDSVTSSLFFEWFAKLYLFNFFHIFFFFVLYLIYIYMCVCVFHCFH